MGDSCWHYRTRVLCRHSAKAEKHSATSLPSVALGEAHTAFLLPAKPALPSAFSRALGKPLPCAKPHSAKKIETGRTIRQTGERNGRTGRTGRPNGTGSKTLPSARRVALGKDPNFAESLFVLIQLLWIQVLFSHIPLNEIRHFISKFIFHETILISCFNEKYYIISITISYISIYMD